VALVLEALRGTSSGGPGEGCTCVAGVGPGSVGMNTSMSLCFPGGGSIPSSSVLVRLFCRLHDLQQSLL
jgi:hypothetical protein